MMVLFLNLNTLYLMLRSIEGSKENICKCFFFFKPYAPFKFHLNGSLSSFMHEPIFKTLEQISLYGRKSRDLLYISHF